MTADAAPQPAAPMLVSVDDDAPVLDAVVADLRARYGGSYRIV